MGLYLRASQTDLGHPADGNPMDPDRSPTKNETRRRVPTRRGHKVVLQPHGKSPDPSDADDVRSWLNTRPRPWAIDLFGRRRRVELGT